MVVDATVKPLLTLRDNTLRFLLRAKLFETFHDSRLLGLLHGTFVFNRSHLNASSARNSYPLDRQPRPIVQNITARHFTQAARDGERMESMYR